MAYGTPLSRNPDLVLVLDTPKGRGVYANAKIPARTVIDVSPVLVFGRDEYENALQHTRLRWYTYNWPAPSTTSTAIDDPSRPHALSTAATDINCTEKSSSNSTPKMTTLQALPLGLGSLFNHAASNSSAHNVGWMRDAEVGVLRYQTLRDVAAGEELCICYGQKGRGWGFIDADGDEEANADLSLGALDEGDEGEWLGRIAVSQDESNG